MADRELWTAKQVAGLYGWHPGYARRWLNDHDIEHVTTTGPRDTRLYDPDQVRAAHDRMPGRGYRTDLRRTTPADPAGPPTTTGAPDMPRTEYEQTVAELVDATFEADLAVAILADDTFGALVGTLLRETGGDYDAMADALAAVLNGFGGNTAEWLVGEADSPAAFIASRI